MWTQEIYSRAEDFLCDYMGTVEAALPHLGGWQPNYSCNDRVREARRFAIARGTQPELAFEHAVIGYARGESAMESWRTSPLNFGRQPGYCGWGRAGTAGA